MAQMVACLNGVQEAPSSNLGTRTSRSVLVGFENPARAFRDLLIAAGATVKHKRFDNSPHGFTLSNRLDAHEGWGMMIDHLKQCFCMR